MAEFNPDEYLKEQVFDPDAFLGANQLQTDPSDLPPGDLGPSFAQPQPERSLGETLTGVGETALTIGTGATSGALGFTAGSIEGVIKNLLGDITQEEAMKLAQERAAAFTYEPKSEAGKEIVSDIGETLGALPPILGTGPVVGLNAIKGKPAFLNSKSPLAKKIAEESTGNIQKSFTKKLGDDRFEPRIFGMVKEARRQGFDDGMTTVIANASPINKRKMLKQVKVMEAGQKDYLYQQKNRPSDIAGDSFLRQVDFVRHNNQQAGTQLGRVAKSLKGKEVDITDATDRFFNDLSNMGVKFDDGNLNFTGSLIEFSAPAKTLITNTITKLKRKPTPDALEAHEFKKFLDEDLRHGKKQEGGVSGAVERVLGSLRSGINKDIGYEYPLYKEANKRFSDTIQSLNDLQDVVGRKLNMEGRNADKAFGVALRSLMSNRQGRANLMDAVDGIETTAKKYGGAYEDDILTQMLFADELESVFGGTARTSLKGVMKGANVESALDVSQKTGAGMAVDVLKVGAKYARGINEKNQLKAIKKLLSAK